MSNLTSTGFTVINSDIMGGTVTYSMPVFSSGTGVSLKAERKTEGISPKLYVNYVKSKLNKIQKEKLKKNIDKLQRMVRSAEDMGQTAYFEELSKMLIVAVREAEALALGVDTWVTKQAIDKFMYKVKDQVIKFDRLEKFPREIPANIRKIIKVHQKANVFDELWILYIDYTGQAPLKSHDEKIQEKVKREKDPILFGKFSYMPNNFYYIADWIDEYCDLTLDKFVEAVKLDSPEYAVEKIVEFDQEWFDKLKAEVKLRHTQLNAPRGSFSGSVTLPPEEKKIEPTKKKSRWKFWS